MPSMVKATALASLCLLASTSVFWNLPANSTAGQNYTAYGENYTAGQNYTAGEDNYTAGQNYTAGEDNYTAEDLNYTAYWAERAYMYDKEFKQRLIFFIVWVVLQVYSAAMTLRAIGRIYQRIEAKYYSARMAAVLASAGPVRGISGPFRAGYDPRNAVALLAPRPAVAVQQPLLALMPPPARESYARRVKRPVDYRGLAGLE